MTTAEVAEQLNGQLADLEAVLEEHIFSRPLNETLAGLDHLDQARLQILLSYVIHDVSWIFLKSRGIDPSTHPVKAELERVKNYFLKLKTAESKPIERNFRPDKDAAARFIRNAIASGGKEQPVAGPSKPRQPLKQQEEPERGTHNRFEFVGRQEGRPAREESSDEEVQVFMGEQADKESSSDMQEMTEEPPKKKQKVSALQRASDRAAGLVEEETTEDGDTDSTMDQSAFSSTAVHRRLEAELPHMRKAKERSPKKKRKKQAQTEVIDLTGAPEESPESREKAKQERAERRARKAARKEKREAKAAKRAARAEAAEAQRAARSPQKA